MRRKNQEPREIRFLEDQDIAFEAEECTVGACTIVRRHYEHGAADVTG